MEVLSRNKVAEIRRLNDAFRTSFRGGQILLTEGVASLPTELVASALLQVSMHSMNASGCGEAKNGTETRATPLRALA